jgi:XRE family aerobic/anaerobic benzoate catabolism transcriptional regulator
VASGTASAARSDRDFLRAFGARVRGERAKRGMSRRLLADHAGISERYIAQLEAGQGNVSLLLLRRVAGALSLPLSGLVDGEEPSPEMTLLRQFLARLSPEQLADAYASLAGWFSADAKASRAHRIALIGLRGAGKSTLGAAAARSLGMPFLELDREIEKLAGTPLGSLLELTGQQAYRRYERDALGRLLETHPQFVVATGGGIVSEPATYEMLLRHCFTVWVQASPGEHMARVLAQGDRRPMAASPQAMEDLKRILAERAPLYARADAVVDTNGATEAQSLRRLLAALPGDRSADRAVRAK